MENINDIPPAAAFQLLSVREPFPPCRALRSWPANYPASELADLDSEEAAETDPSRFVYSDAELEGWSTIVRHLLDEVAGPHIGPRRRYALPKPPRSDSRFRAFLRKHRPGRTLGDWPEA
jgi:hypothetical protein